MKRWLVSFSDTGEVQDIRPANMGFVDAPPTATAFGAFVSAIDELGAFALATELRAKYMEQTDEALDC